MSALKYDIWITEVLREGIPLYTTRCDRREVALASAIGELQAAASFTNSKSGITVTVRKIEVTDDSFDVGSKT